VAQLCVCKEQLSSIEMYWHITPDVLEKLAIWWSYRMPRFDIDDNTYLDILARYNDYLFAVHFINKLLINNGGKLSLFEI
jgi:hypothetical protein